MIKNWKPIYANLMLTYLFFTGCTPTLLEVKEQSEVTASVPANYPELQKDYENIASEAENKVVDDVKKDVDSKKNNMNEQEAKNVETKSNSSKTKMIQEDTKKKVSVKKKWKTFFKDSNLSSLIETALNKNQELVIMAQEIRIAKNEMSARQGEYLPNLGLGAEAGIEKVGEYTSQGASDATTIYEPGKVVPEDLENYRLGLFASWELDVWRKLHNATKSALYRYQATIDGRNFMITRLVAEIANTYYDLMALDKKLEIVNRNIKIQKQALDLVRMEKQAARVSSLAVQRFEAEVLKNRSRRYTLRQKIIQTENKLNFLVGRYPQKIQRDSKHFLTLSPKPVQAGLPSELLKNRPDVRQAEFRLKASKLDVKVAKARFYPSFSMEAGIGYEAFDTKYVFEAPESVLYNLAVNLTAPLLNRKGIKAAYKSANSEQIQAVYDYERTIIKAYTEVANQLSKIDNLDKTYNLKSKQVKTLNKTIETSNVLFKAARADYLEVLTIRRDALESQIELVEVKKKQMTSFVNLYQALGGGWQNI